MPDLTNYPVVTDATQSSEQSVDTHESVRVGYASRLLKSQSLNSRMLQPHWLKIWAAQMWLVEDLGWPNLIGRSFGVV